MADAVAGGQIGQTGIEADKPWSIEQHGIDTIPLADRHGRPGELFFVWSAANTQYLYVVLGALLVGFGLGFWPAVVALVLAHLWYVLLGVGAIPGPKAGTATIVVSRSAFGRYGSHPFAFLSWGTAVGFEAIFIILGTFALYELALEANLPAGGGLKGVCLAVIVGVTLVVALYGHATIVYSQRILTYGLAAGMLILGYFVLSKAHYGTWVVEPVAAKTPFSTWLLGLEVMLAGSAFSWYNYPCDYSRYQRPDASSKAVATWTALGAAIPAIFISTIGVAAATAADLTDPIAGLKSLVPTWFFIPLLLVIVGGAIANNFLNTYTSSLSLLALGLRIARYKTVFIDMTVATAIALYAIFISDLTTTLINFFSLMVLWIAPWAGVYFADILLRRNSYDAAALHQVGPGPYWYTRGVERASVGRLRGRDRHGVPVRERGPLQGAPCGSHQGIGHLGLRRGGRVLRAVPGPDVGSGREIRGQGIDSGRTRAGRTQGDDLNLVGRDDGG
jgi:NCS1 family nucleobase:cation symporter-1